MRNARRTQLAVVVCLALLGLLLATTCTPELADLAAKVPVDCVLRVYVRWDDGTDATMKIVDFEANKYDENGDYLPGTYLQNTLSTDEEGTCEVKFGYNLGGAEGEWANIRACVSYYGKEYCVEADYGARDTPTKTEFRDITLPKTPPLE